MRISGKKKRGRRPVRKPKQKRLARRSKRLRETRAPAYKVKMTKMQARKSLKGKRLRWRKLWRVKKATLRSDRVILLWRPGASTLQE